MALAVLITNNSNGTATIAASGGGAFVTHRIWYCPTTDLQWIELASYVGPGGSTVTMETGCHWFYASTDTEVTSPIMVPITSNLTSVYERILQTVVAEIQSIATAGSLPGLDATKVARQDAIFISNLPFDLPGIVVAPGQQEEDKGGTNERDDLGYPVQVAIVDSKWAKDPDPDSTDINYLLIRERIRRHFQNRRLALVRANVPESYTTKVSYEGILDHQTTEKGLMRFGSYLTLNFATREPRGA